PWWWSSSTLTAMSDPPCRGWRGGRRGGLRRAGCDGQTLDQSAPDAPGEKEDERHEDEPDDEGPRLGEDAQPVLEHEVGAGAHEGTEEGPRAAQERHDDDLPRGGPVQRLHRHHREPEGVQPAREAGEHGGEHEGQVPDAVDVIAAGGGAVAVLADGLEHGAEGRVE